MKRSAALLLALLASAPAHAFHTRGGGVTAIQNVFLTINNAPLYVRSNAQVAGDRLVAGPAFTYPSTLTAGSELDLYEVTTSSCTTASSGNGPTGHGQAITDGTCSLKFDYPVDCRTITACAYDNTAWASGTFLQGDYTISDQASGSPKSYYMNAVPNCTSTIAPTGTGNSGQNDIVPGDGCVWQWKASDVFSFNHDHNFMPTQRWLTGTSNHPTPQLTQNYIYNVGFGGNLLTGAGREYSTANGEINKHQTITFQGHIDFATGESAENSPACANGNSYPKCGPNGRAYLILLQPVPGEGWQDNPNVRTTNAYAYNAGNGVALHGTASHSGFPFGAWLGAALSMQDGPVVVQGLQMKGDNWSGYSGEIYPTYQVVQNNIIDGNGAGSLVSSDPCAVIQNNLVVQRTTNSGNGASAGIFLKYGAKALYNNMVVYVPGGAPASNAVGILQTSLNVLGTCDGGDGPAPIWKNNGVFNFPVAAAFRTTDISSLSTANMSGNVTDSPNSTTSPTFSAWEPMGAGFTYQGVILGGVGSTCTPPANTSSCFNLTTANQFVNSSTDFREASGADIKGAGATFSTTSTILSAAGYTNSLDASRTKRPGASGNYDAGAWNLP